MDSQVKRDADEVHLIVTDPASVPPPPPSDEDVVTSAPPLPARATDVATTVSSPIVEVASRIISHLMCETHHEASEAAMLPLEVQQIPVENGNKMNVEAPSSTFQQEAHIMNQATPSQSTNGNTTPDAAQKAAEAPVTGARTPDTAPNTSVTDPALAAQLMQLHAAVARLDPNVASQVKKLGEDLIAGQKLADKRWEIIEMVVIGGLVVVTLCAVGYGGYRLYKKLTIS
jgi:hypothetical protein